MSKPIQKHILVAVHSQIVILEEQIKFLQESKEKVFEAANISHQTYYNYLKTLWEK